MNTTTTTTSNNMKCGRHHPMESCGSNFFLFQCYLCNDFSKVAVHCPECQLAVCERCLSSFEDLGFAMFLKHEDSDNLLAYKQAPRIALNLVRCPFQGRVYGLHKQYQNMPVNGPGVKSVDSYKNVKDSHHVPEPKVKKAEECALKLKKELVASEERVRNLENQLAALEGQKLPRTVTVTMQYTDSTGQQTTMATGPIRTVESIAESIQVTMQYTDSTGQQTTMGTGPICMVKPVAEPIRVAKSIQVSEPIAKPITRLMQTFIRGVRRSYAYLERFNGT